MEQTIPFRRTTQRCAYGLKGDEYKRAFRSILRSAIDAGRALLSQPFRRAGFDAYTLKMGPC